MHSGPNVLSLCSTWTTMHLLHFKYHWQQSRTKRKLKSWCCLYVSFMRGNISRNDSGSKHSRSLIWVCLTFWVLVLVDHIYFSPKKLNSHTDDIASAVGQFNNNIKLLLAPSRAVSSTAWNSRDYPTLSPYCTRFPCVTFLIFMILCKTAKM